MKNFTALVLALIAALCLGLSASAEPWGEEVILEYAEYCKTHSYKQQLAMYAEMFQADDGGRSTAFFTEEEFLRIKSGENAIITISYELWDEWLDRVEEPLYTASFAFLLDNGEEASSRYRIADRSVFTVKEILRNAGIEDQAENITFAGLETPIEYISGYVFKGYAFLPCESGWNEIDGARYYVKKDGTLATSSLTVGGVRYKFGKNGVCGGKYTGFTQSDKGKRYWKDGTLVKNERFEAKNGRRYSADKDGYLTEKSSKGQANEPAALPKTIPFTPPDPDAFDEYDTIRIDFDEAVSQSYALVRAKCMGLTEQTHERRVYFFTLSEVVSGGEMPDGFYVTVIEGDYGVEDAPSYTSAEIHYKENTEYLLPLAKRSSVFYKEDAYQSIASIFIELGEDGIFKSSTIQGRSIDRISRMDRVKNYLSEKKLTCGQTTDKTGTNFTRSDDLAEVVNSSDYVLEVTISDYFYNLAEDRTTYTCTVTEILKAKNAKITNVYAALPKGGAQIGGRYLLLLNRVSDDSYVYVVSSLAHGVHKADSPTAEVIRGILKEKR